MLYKAILAWLYLWLIIYVNEKTLPLNNQIIDLPQSQQKCIANVHLQKNICFACMFEGKLDQYLTSNQILYLQNYGFYVASSRQFNSMKFKQNLLNKKNKISQKLNDKTNDISCQQLMSFFKIETYMQHFTLLIQDNSQNIKYLQQNHAIISRKASHFHYFQKYYQNIMLVTLLDTTTNIEQKTNIFEIVIPNYLAIQQSYFRIKVISLIACVLVLALYVLQRHWKIQFNYSSRHMVLHLINVIGCTCSVYFLANGPLSNISAPSNQLKQAIQFQDSAFYTKFEETFAYKLVLCLFYCTFFGKEQLHVIQFSLIFILNIYFHLFASTLQSQILSIVIQVYLVGKWLKLKSKLYSTNKCTQIKIETQNKQNLTNESNSVNMTVITLLEGILIVTMLLNQIFKFVDNYSWQHNLYMQFQLLSFHLSMFYILYAHLLIEIICFLEELHLERKYSLIQGRGGHSIEEEAVRLNLQDFGKEGKALHQENI